MTTPTSRDAHPGLFATGALIDRTAQGANIVEHSGNAAHMDALMATHQVRRSADGWFVDGARGQLWEFGTGKLGCTIAGTRNLKRVLQLSAGWAPVTQRGDDEANIKCDWNDETLQNLTRLLGLRRRKRCSPDAVGRPVPRPRTAEASLSRVCA